MIRKTILWVDDAPDWVDSVHQNLLIYARRQHVDLKIVSRLPDDDLLQVFEMFDFDYILMDFQMEPFTGDVYIREIRDHEHLEHIPIIFYSQDRDTNLEALVRDCRDVEIQYRQNIESYIEGLLQRFGNVV